MQIYQNRLNKLIHQLRKLNVDGLIVDDEINLYYLSGLQMSAGQLVVHTNGAYLLADSRYFEVCEEQCPFPVILKKNSDTFFELLSKELPSLKTLGFISDKTSYKAHLELEKKIKKARDEKGTHIALKPIDNPLTKLRMIKDQTEIANLRAAAALGSSGFDFVCSLLKENITEAEIAVELEIFWKRKGGKSLAFDPIIAFGKNSSKPHYRSADVKLQKGDCCLIDIGVNCQNYMSDMTRVVYFGKPDEKLLKIHKIVQEAQKIALNLCRPKAIIGEIDAKARVVIKAAGYGENFTHGLGHGVGLEIHEHPILRGKPPDSEVILEEGMVITIEPGIYLPKIGGVRIEDTVVITKDGYENLTNRPKEPLIIKNQLIN